MLNDLFQIIERKKIVDSRGFLLKTMTGFEDGIKKSFGEIYVIQGSKDNTRANHYHEMATEWFTILQGRVRLNIKSIDNGVTHSILLNEDFPVTVKVNPRVAHTFSGIDEKDYLLMAYSNIKYMPSDTISYAEIKMPLL